MRRDESTRAAYDFLARCEREGRTFTIQELARATSWAENTVRTYFRKKLNPYVKDCGNGLYTCQGVTQFTIEEFKRLMSQKHEVSRDPKKPRLDQKAEKFVEKARESALLAVDLYNRPATGFRSEGFITMMMVAWTALLLGVCCRDSVDFRQKDKKGKVRKTRDGSPKLWGLVECTKHYFVDEDNAMRVNLDFLRELRNEIVHSLPTDLDLLIIGECQATLSNFEDILVKEFGTYYSLATYLAVPLQTSAKGSLAQLRDQDHEVIRFITDYRRRAGDIAKDPRFCMQLWVLPKYGLEPSVGTPAIEFVNYDPSDPKSKETMDQLVAVIIEKPVTHRNLYRPSHVASLVSERIGKQFSVYTHTCAWKFYKVRNNETIFETELCVYDKAHGDYLYTDRWVNFLCKKLSVSEKYEEVINHKWQVGRRTK